MSAVFKTDAGGLWAEKRAGSSLDFVLTFPDLDANDTIASAVWSGDSGVTIAHTSVTTTTATAWIGGGTAGTWYLVSCVATTAAGMTLERMFRVYVSDASTLGAGVLSCFPSIPAAIASIRRDRLVVVARNYLPKVQIEDDYLLEKLVAAEASVARELRVFLTPVELLPQGADQSEIDALTQAGNKVVIEPGYDYTPDLFEDDMWGRMELRNRPIIAVHSIQFVYPTPDLSIFTVPNEWIRFDAQYGVLNLVPVQSAIVMPLNAYLMSALGGGMTIPLMLQIRYRAGLVNAAGDYPDLLDLIKKRVVLSLIEDVFLPASVSDSADGLSQSLSVDSAKLSEITDRKIETLRQSIHGVRMMVM